MVQTNPIRLLLQHVLLASLLTKDQISLCELAFSSFASVYKPWMLTTFYIYQSYLSNSI